MKIPWSILNPFHLLCLFASAVQDKEIRGLSSHLAPASKASSVSLVVPLCVYIYNLCVDIDIYICILYYVLFSQFF